MKYEYKVIHCVVFKLENELNKLGNEGWELVDCEASREMDMVMVAVLKREIK